MTSKRALPVAFGIGLVVAVAGYALGWRHGLARGAETIATLSDQVAAGRAFSQAELALAGLEDAAAPAAAHRRDAAQLRMALDALGGIVLSGHRPPPCLPRDEATQAAIVRHFASHPIAADDPARPILQAAQRYCASAPAPR